MSLVVGVNLLWLVPGVVGGTEEYAIELLDGIGRVADPELDLVVFANRSLLQARPELTASNRVVVAPVDGSARPPRVAAETFWLPRAVSHNDCALVHHLGGTVPARSRRPTVVTVHDLQPLAFPEHFGPVKRRWLAHELPAAVRRASATVALSSFVHDDLVARLDADPATVRVVPPGMASPPVVEAGAVDAVRRVLGLRDRPVFLYPAISYPHKNHRVLLEAQAVLRRSHPEAVLVLTGAAGAEDSTIRERSSRSDLAGSVVIAGRVARPSLEALYATAVATVFPSLYEGFGLPVLEAMARGCPVIAADATALPEVVGRGGMLLDPRSPDHWARAMRRLVEEPSERRRWIAAGAEQAAGFAWERSAAGTIALWKEVVS